MAMAIAALPGGGVRVTPDEQDYESRKSRVVSLVMALVFGVGFLVMLAGIMGHVA